MAASSLSVRRGDLEQVHVIDIGESRGMVLDVAPDLLLLHQRQREVLVVTPPPFLQHRSVSA